MLNFKANYLSITANAKPFKFGTVGILFFQEISFQSALFLNLVLNRQYRRPKESFLRKRNSEKKSQRVLKMIKFKFEKPFLSAAKSNPNKIHLRKNINNIPFNLEPEM